MSTVLRRAEPRPSEGQPQAARLAAIASPKPPRGPVHRRWGRIGAGLSAAVLGSWLFASMYLSAGNRVDVLVVANPVSRFAAIQRSDLRVARVSSNTDVSSVNASRLDEIVGRVAGTDLVAGSVLVDTQLLPSGQKLVDKTEAIVGVLLGPGDAQLRLTRGTPVVIVIRPPTGVTTAPIEVSGWVFGSGGEALSSRERPIELVVPRDKAAIVSAGSADKRVTVVALAE
jgi:hypothetical protein